MEFYRALRSARRVGYAMCVVGFLAGAIDLAVVGGSSVARFTAVALGFGGGFVLLTCWRLAKGFEAFRRNW